MAIRIRSRSIGTLIGGDLAVDITHLEDSIMLGDGTNLVGPLTLIGGVQSIPVDVKATTGATDATLTGGTQKTMLVDASANVGEFDTVGAEKALKVSVISTVGGGAAPAFTDDAAFTIGATQLTPIGALADETTPDSVDEGDVGVLRMTLDRLLKIQIAGLASGVAVPVTDNGGSLTVDGTFWQATQPVSGPLTDAELRASAVPVSGPLTDTQLRATAVPISAASLPLPAGAATQATLASLDGKDFATQTTLASILLDTANMDLNLTTLAGAVAGSEMQVDIVSSAVLPVSDNGSSLTVDGTITASNATGNVAHDAVDSGNPVKIGAKAKQAWGSAVAGGDRVDVVADDVGRIVNQPIAPRDLIGTQQTTISTTTETTIITAGGAGIFNDIVGLYITNSSSTAVVVTLRSSALGTTIGKYAIAANGGIAIQPATPIPGANNGAWTLQLSAAVSSIEVSALYAINVN